MGWVEQTRCDKSGETAMKTLNELYTEVINSEELKNEFLTLKAPEDVVAFAAKYGCTATLDEIKTFFEEKAQAAGELSEDELAQVAGGKSFDLCEAVGSIATLGIECAVTAIMSAAKKNGRCGTAIKGEGMICVTVNKNDEEESFVFKKHWGREN